MAASLLMLGILDTLRELALSFWFMMILLAAVSFLGISFLFGHDHDIEHEIDGADHDTGEDMGLLSPRVFFMFMAGFGAGGFFGAEAGYRVVGSSIAGMISGVAFASVGFFTLNFLYKRQGSSTVNPKNLIGKTGSVQITIVPGEVGRVACWVGDRSENFGAVSLSKERIPVGSRVKIIELSGSNLLVEPEMPSAQVKPSGGTS